MEVDGVAVADYTKVVDHCYLCDLCYLTKCPYVPPHEWNLDFPHLMLRAKAIKFKKGDTKFRDNIITSTDMVGKMASCHWSTHWSTAETKTARCEPHWTAVWHSQRRQAAGIPPQNRPQATCGENIQPAGQLGLWEQRDRH